MSVHDSSRGESRGCSQETLVKEEEGGEERKRIQRAHVWLISMNIWRYLCLSRFIASPPDPPSR